MYPKLIHSKIKLTIGMLVSNHITYIRNCMESIRPLLEAVSSELVIIDTKGTESDGSIDIAREYTDKIYPFTWCNDFAAARNAILDHTNGEWFLYFDDDEWFDDVQEFIDFFQSGDSEKFYTGFYYTRDYSADNSYSMGIAGRMIRRTVNTRFVGKVHEGFNEVFAPNKQFSCFTHHYGYAFSTEESKKAHQDRNLSILRLELKEYGYLPRICAQITQELLCLDETKAEGYDFCITSIHKLHQSGMMGDACSQWLLIASVRYYSSINDYDKMKKQIEYINENYELSEVARLALAAVAIETASKNGDVSLILKSVPQYLAMKEWVSKNQEEALLQTQLDFPRYMTEEYQIQVLQAGAITANIIGQYEQAFHYWKMLPWEKKGFDGSCYQQQLLVTLRGLTCKEPLVSYYRRFYKEECFLQDNQMYLPRECVEALNTSNEMTTSYEKE